MKIKSILLGLCLAFAATPAMADGYNRLELSYDNENYGCNDLDDSFSTNGFSIGYTHGFGLSSNIPLYLEAGLKASFGWHSESGTDDGDKWDNSYSATSLNIPVNVAYKIDLGNGNMAITPYTGLNFRFNLTASQKETWTYDGENEEDKYSWFSKDDFDPTANRFQMGWNIGARFNYGAYGIGIGYTLDFIKFYSEGNYHISTGVFNLALSYTF